MGAQEVHVVDGVRATLASGPALSQE